MKKLPTAILVLALLGAALLALAAVVVPVAAAAPRARPTPPGGPQAAAPAATAPKADTDGDRLFEGLEQRLRTRGPDERLSVIVSLRERATAARVDSLERDVGAFSVRHRFTVIDGFAARMTKRQIESLARNPVVAAVEEDSIASKANDGAQDAFAVSEARLDAPSLDGNADGNLASFTAADLVAAVIDTGIDAGHDDLDEGKVIGWQDFVNGNASAYDDDGHGTHVAATIAGDGDARADHLYEGVAPGAGLVGVKVLDGNGNGSQSDIIAGINWVVANKATFGIEAINMSLRVAGCSNGTDSLSVAANNANTAGIVTVVAAGNEGPGTCKIGSPSAATGVLTVGNMADFSATPRGYYQNVTSSRGPTLDGRVKPDVSAPGTDINSAAANTGTGYANFSGTSMATPFTVGVVLLMLDANSALTTTQVKDKIKTTAIDWARGGNNQTTGTTGQDIDYGFGRLDAYAAIQSAGAPINSPPFLPSHQLLEGTLSGTGTQANFPLTVNDTTFPIAATLIIPAITGNSASSPDFDLYLFDPNGVEVAASEFTTRQEEIGFQPTLTGTYTLRVLSFAGSGGFFVDVSQPQAAPAYPRPGGGTPLRVPLVPAFGQCTSPNAIHTAPLSLSSCSPPSRQSSLLTTSTIGKMTAFASLDAQPGNSATPADEADILIAASATDVRNTAGSDYAGTTLLTTTMRLTDRVNGFYANQGGTVQDNELSLPVACVATPDPSIGGTCSVTTTADTLVPGFAKEGKRSVISAFSFALEDAGVDGVVSGAGCPFTCGTGDEQTYLGQGVFTP